MHSTPCDGRGAGLSGADTGREKMFKMADDSPMEEYRKRLKQDAIVNCAVCTTPFRTRLFQQV